MMWLVGFASAFGIKFSSSVDDVMWLAPFLTSKSSRKMQMQNSIIYISVCMLQTLVAMVIAYSSHEAVAYLAGKHKNMWSTEKMLTVGAGVLLVCYSVKLTYEYIYEEGDEDDNIDRVVSGEIGDGDVEMHPTKDSSVESMEAEKAERDNLLKKEESFNRKEQARQQTLFVIAFIGSVDDLTLFVPMLVGKSFDLPQLMLGALSAALTIVTICIFIGLCKPVADLIAKIPLAFIVIAFAIGLLVKGGFMS